jgi:uncharacterized RDD family membrane protein YckC
LKVAEKDRLMQTIRVETTQNVYIHYPLASVGDRLVAYVLDQIILIIYLIAIIALLIKLEIESMWVPVAAMAIPYFLYAQVCELLMNGQTPGKMVMKIQVVRLDGTPATLGDYIVRCLFQLVDFYISSGAVAMITIAAGNKGQRLGDIVAGTSVVKLKKESDVTAENIFVVPDASYTPVFSEVVNLTSRDIEIIQQALEVNRTYGNNQPVTLLAEKIKAVLGIQTDLPPVKFLYTVVKDFNHLTALPA